MNPETLMALATLLSTVLGLTGGGDVKNQEPAPAAGGNPQPQPVMGAQPQGVMQPVSSQMPGLDLRQLAQAAGAQQAQAAQAGQMAAPEKTPEPKKKGEDDEVKIGEVLAAIPDALQAMDMLFGFNQTNTRTQSPAPVAGGQPGQPVGIFGQPYGQGTNIGQLLAALPGIR